MASSTSTTTTRRWRYEVFLSFRGRDTRNGFISHLYDALWRKGIITFKDDRELERGKSIDEILKAIQDSRVSLIVFSKNFADSTWCLDELLTIFECMNTGKQVVIPVFYDVHPDAVARQMGKYAKAFAKHEEDFKDNIELVRKWRSVMTQITNLSGWHLQDRPESEFIQDIVKDIFHKLIKLGHRFSSIEKDLVGMDSRFEEVSVCLDIQQNKEVLFVGILGMAGMGKTTTAQFVYKKLYAQFEGASFLMNVREAYEKHGQVGLVTLQEQLLSEILMDKDIKVYNTFAGMDEIKKRLCHRKVLVVLDDVNKLDQLKAFANMRDWFGDGSRIIITTRDEHVLFSHGVDKVYRLEGLNRDKSLELLNSRVFHNGCPAEYYAELSEDVVRYACGLPLALDVLGSFLCGKTEKECRDVLSRLQKIPEKDIMEKLRISFDGLTEEEKEIFLDAVCFFKGEDEDCVKKVLTCCGFHANIGIKVLINKSLLTVSKNKVLVHDLLQQMGHEIILQESRDEPGKRSRLWLFDDLHHVLSKDTGTEQVQAIVNLDSIDLGNGSSTGKAFAKMKRLRLLILRNLYLSKGLGYLSNELRYLEWFGYPLKFLPTTFQPDKLVELHMPYSNLVHLWRRTKALPMLKIVDLRYSQYLTKTPDFSSLPNLEKLVMEGCTRLVEVHQSIGALERLVLLNLNYCKSLVNLPHSIRKLNSLEVFSLEGCSRLGKLWRGWDVEAYMKKRSAGGTSKDMTLALPIGSSSMRELHLNDCKLTERAISMNLSHFSVLEDLFLPGNDFTTIPSSISGLSKLKFLVLTNCNQLQSLPDLPASLECLEMSGCSALSSLPNPSGGRQLKPLELIFLNCENLTGVQGIYGWLKPYLQFLLNNKRQGMLDPQYRFLSCIPGNKIPIFFSHQSDGSLVHMPLSESWCNSRWMGLAFCAVFRAVKHPIAVDRIRCRLWALIAEKFPWSFRNQFLLIRRDMQSDHLWLSFIPRECLETEDYHPDFGFTNPDSSDWWNGYTKFFAFFDVNPKEVQVKSCGLRLVYEDDAEELIRSHHQSS